MGLPSRSDVPILYRKTITMCALLCIGSDIVHGGLYGFWQADITSLYGIYGLGQSIVAGFFLCQARTLYRPLLEYLNHPESNPLPEKAAQIKYLSHNLKLSGTAMLFNTSSIIVAAVASTGTVRVTSAFIWFGGIFIFSASRISTSYYQVSVSRTTHALIKVGYCKLFHFVVSIVRSRLFPHTKKPPYL
jgi:hypothetical protein